MFAGLMFTKASGRIMGGHQKIDRVARRHVGELLPENTGFPATKEILKFEGKNGPDGIKVKSPARNEPWHFLDPFDNKNDDFLEIIQSHYDLLVKHLKEHNRERSAFEAAWLSHALVDGMTPPHHYPYEKTIKKLRGGKGIESRTSYRDKLIFKGETKTKTIANTYKVHGPKGLMNAHFMFEHGFGIIVRLLRFPDARPVSKDIKEFEKLGPQQYFIRRAREIAGRDMFGMYLEKGWTPKLSHEVRHHLAPTMVKTVSVAWFCAAKEAGLCA